MKWFIQHFEKLISSFAFAVMLIMVIINVISRYFFGHSFSYTEEIAFMGFTYCVFFGVCILYKNHALIAIDVIVDRLPPHARHAAKIFNFALLTIANMYFIYLSTKLSIGAWVRPTAALRIPYTFIDMSAAAAFVLLTLYSARFLIDAVRGKEAASTTPE
ncbi:TRAP transporter small permease [Paenibacillus thalictri]|nr:TRAP transporter small permease [Paenibacillus thalictri]